MQPHELGRSLDLRTKPRVSPTPVVNHSSLRSDHPSTTGTLLVHIGLRSAMTAYNANVNTTMRRVPPTMSRP
jgi:hypothetical protein